MKMTIGWLHIVTACLCSWASDLCIAADKEKFWSFRPLVQVKAPDEGTAWSKHPIDRFLFKKMQENSLLPNLEASRRILIRRMSFDLIGLPPTSEEVDAFVRDDSSDAFEKVMERLLASPHYGERWGRHWLDLARYTDKTAKWLNSTASAWLYRDWVVQAFNRDLPYNEFVIMQLANDLVPHSDPKNNAALGFLGLSPTYWKELRLPPEIIKTTVADEWEERMDAIGRTFLGLTLGCARCHDHKTDPLTQADYYAIAGVFASVRIADRPIIKEELWAPVTKARKKVAALEKEMAELKKKKGDEQTVVSVVRAPEFPETYSAAIAKLKPAIHTPLNTTPQNLVLEKGTQVSSDNFGTFKSGRMHGEVKTLDNAYALSFWFRNDLLNSARPITAYLFSRGPNANSAAIGDHFGIGGTHSKFDGVLFLFNGDRAKVSLRGKTVITPGTWNHVVLIRSDSRVKVFLNGETKPELEGKIKLTATESKKFFIGGRNDRFALLSGRMAHFTFFDREITTEEALKLHAASGQPKGPKTEPKESVKPVIAKTEPHSKIENLRKQIEAIKSNTPHYDMPLVNGVDEAALFVNPAKGKHGTTLDYTVGKGRNLAIHVRGNPNVTGAIMPRRFLNVFPGKDGKARRLKKGSGRLELAEAIVNEAAPLAARVIVNRVWQHHFGRGLVPTPSELGFSGEPPSHPELLNDLTARFVKSGWSIKWLHREIIRSAAWKQSIPSTHAQKLDPDNQLLSHMNRRRLDVEAWRDAMLQVSGKLDLKLGGEPMELNSAKNNRRTIYGTIHRRELNQMLSIHDFPDPTAHAPSRSQTITPLQQLFSLNGPFIQWQAEALAANLIKAESNTNERVNIAYKKLFQRTARKSELELARGFLDQRKDLVAAWTEYAHALLASNEFLFIE